MKPREKEIEDRLCTLVAVTGGEVRKITFVGRKGAPDRLCIWPQFPNVWVELKRPGKTPDYRQRKEIKALRAAGEQVEVLDSIETVEGFIERHCDG